MKNYATCEHCIDHSLCPRLHEYLFEVANVLLTVSRTDGKPAGNPILLKLEIMEDVRGSSLTHRKGFDDDEIYTWQDWWASLAIISSSLGARPTKEI